MRCDIVDPPARRTASSRPRLYSTSARQPAEARAVSKKLSHGRDATHGGGLQQNARGATAPARHTDIPSAQARRRSPRLVGPFGTAAELGADVDDITPAGSAHRRHRGACRVSYEKALNSIRSFHPKRKSSGGNAPCIVITNVPRTRTAHRACLEEGQVVDVLRDR